MTENTREITIDDARKLYHSSEEAKTFLLSKFTKDELEGKNIPSKNIPSQEEFNKFFEESIFPLIDYSKTTFLDCNTGNVSKTPTSSILLFNSSGEWLFDYNYDQKTPFFYYSYYRVYPIFMNQFDLQSVDRRRLMKSMVEKHFSLMDTQPRYGLENHRI